MKNLIFSGMLLASAAFASDNGLITGVSDLSVDETVDKFTKIIKEKSLKVFDVVEHSKLAKEVGLEMTDTSVVIFGAPKVGTLLMQCSPQIALELPMKFLIYKEGEKTIVAYEDIKNIAKRYKAQDCAPVSKISEAQANFFKALTK